MAERRRMYTRRMHTRPACVDLNAKPCKVNTCRAASRCMDTRTRTNKAQRQPNNNRQQDDHDAETANRGRQIQQGETKTETETETEADIETDRALICRREKPLAPSGACSEAYIHPPEPPQCQTALTHHRNTRGRGSPAVPATMTLAPLAAASLTVSASRPPST